MLKIGLIISDKMNKTRIVLLNKYVQINKLKNKTKFFNKIFIHDEYNLTKYGDIVSFTKTSNFSKKKNYLLIKKLR